MVKYAMVIDLNRCMGCNACAQACKVENNTGEDKFWMHVFRVEEGEYPYSTWRFMPMPCQHCDNAPCVKVCPVGARYKEVTGAVLTDFERCIGCRFCVVACPYGVNYFNWSDPAKNQYYDWNKEKEREIYGGKINIIAIPPYKNPDHAKLYGSEKRLVSGGGQFKGVVEKCTFCVHRVEKGLDPACVQNCPVHALHFGDISDPNSEVFRLVAERHPGFRLLEDLGTLPSVYYLGTPLSSDVRPWAPKKEVKEVA